MKASFSQILDELDSLLESREYDKILATLDDIDVRQLESDEDRSRYYHLKAKSYRALGKYEDARRVINAALELSRKIRNYSLVASQKHLSGLISISQGRVTDAIEEYTEAYVYRKKAGENDKIYSSLVNRSYAHFLNGSLKKSLEVLQDALAFAKQYNTEKEIRLCETNITRVLILMGRFRDAELMLVPYLDDDSVSTYDRAFVKQSLGMIYTYLVDAERADKYLQESQAVFEQENLLREQVVGLEYRAILAYNLKKSNEAEKFCREILSRSEITTSAEAQTLRLLTDILIVRQDWGEAKKTAMQAEKVIRQVNENIELGALFRALGQIYEHEGDKKLAREALDRSKSILYETGAKYEEALTLETCGRSSVYTEDEQLESLVMAKRLYKETGVEKLSERVSDHLKAFVDDKSRLPKVHLPLVGWDITTRQTIRYLGLPLLIVGLVTCILGLVKLGGTPLGFVLFFAGGMVALQSVVMMKIIRRREKEILQDSGD